MNKKRFLSILFSGLILVLFNCDRVVVAQTINNFDDCANAGNPVMQSYPRQCQANGKTYVENISNAPSSSGPVSSSASSVGVVSPGRVGHVYLIIHNLRPGMRSDEIIALQQKLQALGYFPKDVEPSRYFGSLTKKAVIAFQKAKGLPTTGTVGPLTRKELQRAAVRPPITITFEAATIPNLRYKLLDKFGNILFCDPDFYPIPRWDEKDAALKVFPDLQKTTDEFQAIINHHNLLYNDLWTGNDFRDDQKLWIYREHKKLRAILLESSGEDKYKFSLLAARTQPGYEDKLGTRTEGFIDGQGTITVSKSESAPLMCPICLASNSNISTPNGEVNVQNIKVGMHVWSLDKNGKKVISSISGVSKTFLPDTHKVVHLALTDHREVWVSPAHPTVTGGIVGDLVTGGLYDGSKITSAELIPYWDHYTYDLLPDSDTGFYWANGILLGSTLFQN